jgi:nitrogen regulatory protein P-II 2
MSMQTVALKLITIIAEAVLEERLIREIKQLGAKGYTVGEVLGQGSRGIRASDWEGKNVKLEALVSAEVADHILQHVADHYFAHYAVIVYAQDVQVIRSEKYQ